MVVTVEETNDDGDDDDDDDEAINDRRDQRPHNRFTIER